MRLKVLDWVILAASAALVTGISAVAYGGTSTESSVFISGPHGEWIYPLDKELRFEVEGPLGATVVEISGGKTHIEASPCPNQTCVASGSISLPGQWIACLPNKVFVRVEGRAQDDSIDAGAW